MKRHIALILFFLVVSVGFMFSPVIGPSWDEPDNMFSAGVYVNFFRNGFDPAYFEMATNESLAYKASAYGDRIVPQYRTMAELPPLHNYVGALLVSGAKMLGIGTSPAVIIAAFHWATVLFLGILVAFVYRFGILLGLSTAGSIFAALTVFLYPQVFGHGLSNIKDTAQAALFVTSLYYLVKKNFLAGAIIWGLGLATKFNAIYVPVIWGIWYMLTAKKHRIQALYHILGVLITGILTVCLVWPYLWFDTIGHAGEIIRHFTTVGAGYRVIWDGVWYVVGAGRSLFWYPILSFIYTTPIPLLILFFFGIIQMKYMKNSMKLLLPIWILIPLVRTLSPWSSFYDLLRHFIEIIPALILVAATGFDWFFQKKQRLLVTGIMLGIIIVGYMAYINITYFPYSTGYYNRLVKNPNTNFDRDIEALSVKEAMDFVHKKYGNVRIYFTIGGHQSRYYLNPGDWYVNASEGMAEIVVVVNKASHVRSSEYIAGVLHGYTLVHEIRRGDAVFAWIYKKD